MSTRLLHAVVIVGAALTALNMGGCNVTIPSTLVTAQTDIQNTVGTIQAEDPRNISLPTPIVTHGDTIVLDPSVVVITDVATQVVVQDVPDITVLGFDNATGFDMYLRYYADGQLQAVWVNDGDSLLLQYACLSDVELISEDHFDPATGDFVEGFDYSGDVFSRPTDFDCGDAFILTFDPQVVTAHPPIPL